MVLMIKKICSQLSRQFQVMPWLHIYTIFDLCVIPFLSIHHTTSVKVFYTLHSNGFILAHDQNQSEWTTDRTNKRTHENIHGIYIYIFNKISNDLLFQCEYIVVLTRTHIIRSTLNSLTICQCILCARCTQL